MKLDRLLAFTRQPELLATDESDDLETLLEEYPYFSAAQLLLAIKYKKQNSSRLNRQLQRAAAHLPDKNVLAAALDEVLAQLQQIEQQKMTPAVSVEMSEPALDQPTVTDTQDEIMTPVAVQLEMEPQETFIDSTAEAEILDTESMASVAESGLLEGEKQSDLELEGEKAFGAEVEIQELHSFEKTIEPESLEHSILNSTETDNEEVLATGEEEEQPAKVELLKIVDKPEEIQLIKPAMAQQQSTATITSGEQQFIAQPHDRLSWFRFFAGKPLREQPDDVLEELYLEHMSGDFLQAKSATLPEIKTELKAVINHDPEVASDKSLEEEIRRLAYESISDEELPASETLAAIYESQKDYKKALRIYQKLMLKFPDRMTYFAGLIATTKEKLNN